MPDLILHHYPASPFAEKIRLVLGYKKLAWKSVIIPSIMPKPDLVALTGGYRRTPERCMCTFRASDFSCGPRIRHDVRRSASTSIRASMPCRQ